ncbi:MAG: radical SAM protein [Planctomycetota bacterium]|nr:MAG: radical SAM protein [Planctomycetota bacterium]
MDTEKKNGKKGLLSNQLSLQLGRAYTLLKREWNARLMRPVNACLEPTYRCNLKCQTCFFGVPKNLPQMGYEEGKEELSFEEQCSAIDQLKKLGVSSITYIGGETLLRKDSLDVMKYMKDQGLFCLLITNGTMVTPEVAKKLVEIGVDRIVVSLDALDEKFDIVRGGKKAFNRIKNAITALLEERSKKGSSHPFVGFHMTISKLNIEDIVPLVSFSKEKGVDEITMQYFSETAKELVDKTVFEGEVIGSPRFIPRNGSLLLSGEQIKELREALKQVDSSIYVKMLHSLSDEELAKGYFPVKKCYSTRDTIIINPFGDVYLCPNIDRYVIGNIREEPLEKIWGNEKHMKLVRHLSKNLFEVCRSCCSHLHNMTPFQLFKIAFFH